MIRKILKWIFKLILATLLLVALSYGAFHLWEYSTGGKYVDYLTKNSETIPLEESFSYQLMEPDIEKSKLILVGEIHGFEEPLKFDLDFFKYLHENHQVNHYLAELDFVQAGLLNEFLQTGNEDLLKEVLKNWFVLQGRNNKGYFNKYLELHHYYTQLPEENKFEFIGIDKIQDMELISKYLSALFPSMNIEESKTLDIETLLIQIDTLSQLYTNSSDTLFILSHLKTNLQYRTEKVNREEVMYQNFRHIYTAYHLEESKLYGYFGLYHVFQYRVNAQHPFASKIRQSDLGLEEKILSVNFFMVDSYTVMDSKSLPKFIRDEGKYTRMPITSDNMLFMYIYGVKDFKRMTAENHKSLIKMNAENNPYSGTNRLNKTIQILPVTKVWEMTDQGKPYVQYTVFVRNSDWAEPMIE